MLFQKYECAANFIQYATVHLFMYEIWLKANTHNPYSTKSRQIEGIINS